MSRSEQNNALVSHADNARLVCCLSLITPTWLHASSNDVQYQYMTALTACVTRLCELTKFHTNACCKCAVLGSTWPVVQQL